MTPEQDQSTYGADKTNAHKEIEMAYGVFEKMNFSTPKRRVMVDVVFQSVAEAVDYFNANGHFAEADADGHDAADVCTKFGTVLMVEAI